MDNKLIEIQKLLLKQMNRLNDDDLMEVNAQEEISRANSLSQNATTFLKSVNIGIRTIEIARKYDIQKETLSKELGIYDEE